MSLAENFSRLNLSKVLSSVQGEIAKLEIRVLRGADAYLQQITGKTRFDRQEMA
jgi:hypothetical protein